jgi:hypothetical protein
MLPLLVAALLLTLPAPALAQDGATFGARPGPGDGDRSSGSLDISVGAGSSVSDAVEILNFSDDPATFDIYAADVVPTTDGGLAPAAREAEITGPAAWVTVGQPTVEVTPRGKMVVSFSVKVPAGTPAGDTTAALLVERRPSIDSDVITSVTRVGLWLKLSVTNPGNRVLGDTGVPWGVPWIIAILVGVALLALLAYGTRDRRRRWLQDRRDERALLRDFRNRRHDETTRKQS